MQIIQAVKIFIVLPYLLVYARLRGRRFAGGHTAGLGEKFTDIVGVISGALQLLAIIVAVVVWVW